MKKITLLITCSALVITMLAGCTGQKRAAVARGEMDQLSVISPHQKSIHDEWVPKFKAWYTARTGREVNVEWMDQGGTSDNLKFIISEFARNPESVNIDIFWGGGNVTFIKMTQDGYLSPYKLPDEILKNLPKAVAGQDMYDAQYHWYGSAVSTFGILYNKEMLRRENMSPPVSWEDLGHPSYYGQVIGADPRHSGSAGTIYSVISQAYPWAEAWGVLTRMAANTRGFIQSASRTITAVTGGESAAAPSIDFYAWNAVERYGEDSFGFTMPEGLTLINPDPVAIMKGAPNRRVAELFVEFVMSPENQKLWVLPAGVPGGPETVTLGRIPMFPNLLTEYASQTVVKVNPFVAKGSFVYDSDKGSQLWAVLNDLVGAFLVDTNTELRRGWRAVIDNGLKPEAVAELIKMPLTEADALELSERWGDQLFRNQTITEWQNFARQKYAKAATY